MCQEFRSNLFWGGSAGGRTTAAMAAIAATVLCSWFFVLQQLRFFVRGSLCSSSYGSLFVVLCAMAAMVLCSWFFVLKNNPTVWGAFCSLGPGTPPPMAGTDATWLNLPISSPLPLSTSSNICSVRNESLSLSIRLSFFLARSLARSLHKTLSGPDADANIAISASPNIKERNHPSSAHTCPFLSPRSPSLLYICYVLLPRTYIFSYPLALSFVFSRNEFVL